MTYLTDTEGTKSILTLSLCDADGNNFAQISQPEVSDGSYIIGENSIVSYTGYDEKGNVTSETDGKGIVTTYTYDEEDRLTSCNIDDTDDADDITVSYASTEADGNITTITDAGGNVKTEKQDWNGLTTETADISKSGDEGVIITNTEYDDKGRKTRESFSDDTYIVYTYNGSSANISKASSYRGDTDTPESETTYTYDNADRMVSAIVTKDGSNVSTTSYTYDAEGKKLTETVSYGLESEATTSYSYDAMIHTDGQVYFGDKLTKAQAVWHLKHKSNVMATTAKKAKSACKEASPIGVAQYDSAHKKAYGYRKHYHPVKNRKKNKDGKYKNRIKAHCFY